MLIATRQGQVDINDQLTITLGASDYQVEFGQPVLGIYVERFYTPIIGPTQVMLLRHVVLEHHRTTSDLVTTWHHLARNVGLGASGRRLSKALNRLQDYGMIQPTREGYLFPTHVCTHWKARINRLTDEMQELHHRFLEVNRVRS